MNIWLEKLNDSIAHEIFTFKIRNDNREYFKTKREITTSEHNRWINHTLSRDDISFYIIYDGEFPVGTISLRTDGPIGEIGHVCVDVSYRRKGIATIALTMIERIAKERRLLLLHLTVLVDNPTAISLYQASGYEAQAYPVVMTKEL